MRIARRFAIYGLLAVAVAALATFGIPREVSLVGLFLLTEVLG